MNVVMKVHSLSLDRDTGRHLATLYRHDAIKERRQRGWIDRVTMPAEDLQLGDLVDVTVTPRTDPSHAESVTPVSDDESTDGESEGGAR
jgi:hypothetical protein